MKTQLMRKDPLQLMEYALEVATATAAAAEQTKTLNVELVV